MAIDKKAYALANSYTDETVIGGGAIKGKNCTISKIEDIDGGHRITFNWTLDNGTTKSQTLDVKDGADGYTPVKGVDYFDGQKGDKGETGANGVDGYSPTVVENANNTESDYKLDITDVNGTFTTPNLMGKQGIQGLKGERGETGLQGPQGIQGAKGDKGEDGLPFLIYKQYEVGIEEFNEADFPEVGLMFMVHVFEEGKGYPVYRYTADGTDTPYSLVTYMNTEGIKGEKGDKGDQGEQGIAGIDGKDGTTYTPSIGEVTTVESNVKASATVSVNDETKEAVFNFAIPKGKDGDRNADTVNNHTVESDVPKNAVFTDTIYDDTEVKNSITEINRKLDGLSTYSTEETICGTWIDGKPIYRKVITYTLSNALTGLVEIAHNIQNIETPIRIVFGKASVPGSPSSSITIPSQYDSTTFIQLGEFSDTYVQLFAGSTNWTFMKEITLCLEYTKTTN